MREILDVPPAIARAGARQRRMSIRAIEDGEPARAAPRDQVDRRQAYIRRHWPELGDEIEREGLVGPNDMLWSSYLGRGARAADAVGRVCVRDEPAERRAGGTGFLVAPSAMLTNFHVLDRPELAAECVIEFCYEYTVDGAERRAQIYELDPERLFVADRELDYALVAVSPRRGKDAGAKPRGFLPLIAQTGKTRNGEYLNLLHHPGGGRKRISVRHSNLLAIEEQTLQYTGDTLGGSSGAPVLNDQWEVVALHFGGKPKRDAQRRILTPSGTPWSPEMGEHLKAYEFNVGARVSRILADMERREKNARGDRELLRSVINGGTP